MRSIQIAGAGIAAALLAAIGTPANAQVIQKIGNSCPNGYHSSGNFCKAWNANSKHAIPNPGGGGCPNGYHSSGGNYCLSWK